MKIAIPFETADGEKRVSATPETVKKLCAFGIDVIVEKNAGLSSDISDDDYTLAGAVLADDFEKTVHDADVVFKIKPPTNNEIALLKKGSVLIADIDARRNSSLLKELAKAGINCFALDLIPRTSRAQSMDVLSSQMNLAGYKAVIDAVAVYRRAVPLMMTAAGTIPAARVLVLGAGVAGLQAIATAKRLGAVVFAFDVRPVAKEQVESLGAKFVCVESDEAKDTSSGYASEMSEEYKKRQSEAIAEQIKKADIVISTASVPGKKAPVLITKEMVDSMRYGSVIVDLASMTGGNCTETVRDDIVVKNGVTIIGYSNLPSRLASDASALYAKNILAFFSLIFDKENKTILFNVDDDIIKATLIVLDGKITKDEVS